MTGAVGSPVSGGGDARVEGMGPSVAFFVGGLGLSWPALSLSARVSDALGHASVAAPFFAIAAVAGAGLGMWAVRRLPGRTEFLLGKGAFGFALLSLWSLFLALYFDAVADLAASLSRWAGAGALGTAALGATLCALAVVPLFALAGALCTLFLGAAGGMFAADERHGHALTALAGAALSCLLFGTRVFLPPLSLLLATLVPHAVLALALWGAWHRVGDPQAAGAAAAAASPGTASRLAPAFAAASGFFLFGAAMLWPRLSDAVVGLLADTAGLPAGILLASLALGAAFGKRLWKTPALRDRGAVLCGVLVMVAPWAATLFPGVKGQLLSWVQNWGLDTFGSVLSVYAFASLLLLIGPAAALAGLVSSPALSDCLGKGPGLPRTLLFFGIGAAAGPAVVSLVFLPAWGFIGAAALLGSAPILLVALSRGVRNGWEGKEWGVFAAALALSVALSVAVVSWQSSFALALAAGPAIATLVVTLIVTSDRSEKFHLAGAVLLVAVAWVVLNPGLHAQHPVPGYSEALFDRQGSVSGVQVHVSEGDPRTVALVVNGIGRDLYSRRGGHSPKEEAATLAGLLPVVYRPDAGRVAIIGGDFGATARAALLSPRIERLTTVEGERKVHQAVVSALEQEVHGDDGMPVDSGSDMEPFADPRHSLAFASPRAHFALGGPGAYDAVVLSRPDIADGVDAPLFSARFLRSVARALADDGVLVVRIRTARLSERTLAALVRAVGDTFGEQELFVSRNSLLVVAAKPGSGLGEPSGSLFESESARRAAGDSGFHGLGHVMAHRVASGRLARPYFESFDIPGRGATGLHHAARRDRLAVRSKPFLSALLGVNLPLVAMMEDRALPEPEAATGRIHTPEAGRFVYANVLWSRFLGDGPADKALDPRHVLAMERLLETGRCPADRDGWLDAVADLRVAMGVLNPVMNPGKMDLFWERVLRRGCWDRVPEEMADLVAYYRALSARDHDAIIERGSKLASPGSIAESESARMLLLSLMVARHRTGDRVGLLELMSLVPASVSAPYRRLVHFVSAGAFVGDRAAPEGGDDA